MDGDRDLETHHRAPVEQEDVGPVERPTFGEEVAEEEGLHGRTPGVQARERPKGDGRARERLVVAVAAEERVDTCEATGRAPHLVGRRDEAFSQLVPCVTMMSTCHHLEDNTGATHRVVRTGRRSG